MNRLVYFLMVGLAVIALQATTVEAQGGDPNMPPPTGAPGTAPMGDPNMAPPAGDISHCAEFSGPPKEACEAAATGK